MQLDPSLLQKTYQEFKFYATLGGGLFGLFKIIEYIRGVKENDLPHLQGGVNALHTELKDQTNAIVGELRELRQDLRTFR